MTSETLPEIPIEAPRPEHPAWSLMDVFWVALAGLLGIIIAAVIAVVIWSVATHGKTPDPKTLGLSPYFFIPVQLGSYLLGLLAAVTLVRMRSHLPFRSAIRWNPGGAEVRFAAAGSLLALLVLFTQRFVNIPKNLPIEQLFKQPGNAWLLMLFGVFIAPLAEEVFFRGLLFPALGRAFSRKRDLAWLGGTLLVLAAFAAAVVYARWHLLSHTAVWMAGIAVPLIAASQMLHEGVSASRGLPLLLAVVCTAASFALIHQGQLAGAIAPLTILFCVGMVLTVVRHNTDSVCASWLVHFSYNATLFGVMLVATHGFRNLEPLAR